MEDQPAPPFYHLTEDNRAALVVVAALIFLVYAILGVVIKLFVRLNITSMRDFDIILLIGTLVYTVQTGCVVIACNHGLGQHQDVIPADDFAIYSKSMYASRLLSLAVHGCAKISVNLLIRQISDTGFLHKANMALSIIVVIWVVSGIVATAFQCALPEPWLAISEGQCPGLEPVYVYNGVMNIITDIGLCLLPVVMMWEVQTPTRRKAIVMALFGSRAIVPIMTIPSIATAHPLFDNYTDSTWLSVSSTIWFQISLGLSVLTACIPSLKGVIDSLLGATAVTAIHAPYELRSSGNKSGLTATRVTDDSKQGSRGNSNNSGGGFFRASAKRKSAALGTWTATEHQVSALRTTPSRTGSPVRSESVRKLTEGVIVVRDEVEVAYDDTGRTATVSSSLSRAESRESSYAEYRM